MKTHFSVLNIVVLLALSATGAVGQDVQAIAKAVDDHYNRLHTLQAEFTEIYRGAGAERTEAGTLWLKKPGKMRWEYRSPSAKLFVSDGRDAWLYLPADKQVRRTPVRKLDDLRSPLALLLGKTKLEKELHGLSVARDQSPIAAGNVVLRGVPKQMADRIREVLLEITPNHQLARIQVDDVDGAITEYRFSEQKENLQAADERFRFRTPPGVESTEGDWGQ